MMDTEIDFHTGVHYGVCKTAVFFAADAFILYFLSQLYLFRIICFIVSLSSVVKAKQRSVSRQCGFVSFSDAYLGPGPGPGATV